MPTLYRPGIKFEGRPLDYPNPPLEGMPAGPNARQALAHSIECDELLYGGSRGGGKSISLCETLISPSGTTTMGAVQVGDLLLDEMGKPCRVTYKSPVQYGPCFRLTFSDGARIVADDKHRWFTWHGGDLKNAAIRDTETLAHLVKRQRHTVAADGRYIVSIVPCPTEAAACIAVDSPSHLYLAGPTGIPTHNTDYAIAEALAILYEFPGAKAAIFRRSYPELMQASGIVERLTTRVPPSEAKFVSGPPPRWEFKNGSILWAAHLTNQSDVARFLGGEYQLFVFEQAEQVDELTFRLLKPSLRVSGVVAKKMREAGYRPKAILTANPGTGPHTEWLRERFIDPFPKGEQVFLPAPTPDEPSPGTRCFIPAFLDDNPALAIGDPTYRQKLESLPADQRAAQLYGDWYQHAGMRFKQFRADTHVIEPSQLPIPLGGGIQRGLGIDYGVTQAYVGLWGAVMNVAGERAYVIYREVDATGLSPREQARQLLDAEVPGERAQGRPIPTALDPSCWTPPPDKPVARTSGGSSSRSAAATTPPPGSIADSYWREGLMVRRADNRRIEGAALISDLLTVREDGRPRLYIYSSCVNLIKTLPKLQRDPNRPEDVIGKDIDHWYDAARYLLMLLARSAPGAAATESLPSVRARRAAPVVAETSAPGSPPSLRRLRRQGF